MSEFTSCAFVFSQSVAASTSDLTCCPSSDFGSTFFLFSRPGHALSAGFAEQEVDEVTGHIDHARRVVAHNHALCLEKSEIEEAVFLSPVLVALDQAFNVFEKMRKTEGEMLKKDILEKCDNMENALKKIDKKIPNIVEEMFNKRRNKMKEILGDIDEYTEEKLIYEAGSFAEKSAVDEEAIRLKSHIGQVRENRPSPSAPHWGDCCPSSWRAASRHWVPPSSSAAPLRWRPS